jgi:hypothetical protein
MLLNVKCVFWSYVNFCPSRFSFYQQQTSCMYVILRVKHPLFLSDFNETSSFSKTQISSFHKNATSGSRAVPRGRADMTKLIIFFAILRAHLTNRRLAKRSHLTKVADIESSNTTYNSRTRWTTNLPDNQCDWQSIIHVHMKINIGQSNEQTNIQGRW